MAIKIKPSRKGLLHEKLGVPQGDTIPAQKIAKAERSRSPALRKEAQFAENAKHFHHSSQDEAHYDAKKKNKSLHETLVHEDLGAEANRHVHKDPGDHGSGQSLHNSKAPTTKAPPRNPHGNPGYHASVRDFEHQGYAHTSKHR